MMNKPKKESTYERIIKASLKLFNENGERYVTTNHIVAHLGISPGNLYYYFQNKDEIIEEIFKRYERDLLEFILHQRPDVEGLQSIEYITSIFNIMWDYRFIFTDINVLLERNENLRQAHHNYTVNKVTPVFHSYLDYLVKLGLLNMSRIDLEIFKTNFWIIVRYWFVFEQSFQGELREDSKLRGSLQILGLLKPYLNEENKQKFNEAYLRLSADLE